MKKITLTIINYILIYSVCSAQTWQWARNTQGAAQGWSIAKDISGNLYVAGSFNDSATFGSYLLTTPTSNDRDPFLVKYDSNGNVLWARSGIATATSAAASVCVDGAGNIYVAGNFFTLSITFGSVTLTNVGGGSDMFVVKYDSGGNVLWALSVGGNGMADAIGVVCDTAGHLYMTGQFASSTIVFGSTTLTNPGPGNFDICVVKYDTSGNVIWAKRAGGTDWDSPTAIALDNSGNIFLTGYFGSTTASFGTINLLNSDGTGSGATDIFIVKYDANGNTLWAKQAGGYNSDDQPNAVSTDASGNAYIAGYFTSDTAYFDSIILRNADTLSNFSSDMFIAKYNSNGNVVWAKRAGGMQDEAANCIIADSSGKIYVGGYFYTDSLLMESAFLYNNGSNTTSDILVARYDSSGNVLWAKNIGGAGIDLMTSITTDGSGNIFATGYFQSPQIIFGPDILNNLVGEEVFVALLDDNLACSASFNLYPDTSTPHLYWGVNYASGTPPLHYDWDWGDGSPHDTAAYPSHTYATAGYYTICLTIADAVSCTNTVCQTNLLQVSQNSAAPMTMVQVNVVASTPTGITKEELSAKSIFLFPNPAKNDLTVNSRQGGVEEIEIYNVLGEKRLTLNPSPKGEGLRVDVSSLPPGIYFVKVKADKGTSAARFVKM